MSDNKTAHDSSKYDLQVRDTIPYYDSFHNETINMVKAIKGMPEIWLDTGCGTGTLVEKACQVFTNTSFILADPSIEMIREARKKFSLKSEIEFLEGMPTQDITLDNTKKPDVITAIQAHHYLSIDDRYKAVKACFNLLKENGVYISFENIKPFTDKGIELGKRYWANFQLSRGKSEEMVKKHMDRFNMEYFPITVDDHIELLKEYGFRVVELFWYSYMQAGFYCVK